ncbi:uncharacterized protein [Diabrotica undecimpunctata]|uniref:uncharacterized protein isoform X3 n=1 Tax=Diabrotica undecimpunctata TaxID=50387 RepID=UPI003B641F7A
MDKNKSQTFILSLNDFGQKICRSQSEPDKKYILDDEGNMTEYYDPETSVCTLNLDSQGIISEGDSNDTSNSEHNNISALEDPTQLGTLVIWYISLINEGIMNSLDGVSEFEEKLMNDLDSDFLNIEPCPHSDYIMQHMDIREPLSKLKKLIENRLGISLQGYAFSLQDVQILDDNKNLVEQCVQGEGLVQVNVQIQTNLKRINIIDVLKPAEDYVHIEDNEEVKEIESPKYDKEEPKSTEATTKPKFIVQWQVDGNYKKEQERLKIPSDPMEWTALHVRHWVQWAVRQFNLTNIKLSDWLMDGKQLVALTIEDFQKIVPSDPGDIFWTHIELLRKMKLVGRTFPAVWTRNYNYHPIKRSIFFEKPKTAPQLRKLHDTSSKDVFTSGFYQINKKTTKQIPPYVRVTDIYRQAMECTNQYSNTERKKKRVTNNYSCINLQLSPIKVEEFLHERNKTGSQKQRPRKKQIIQPKQLPQVQQKTKKAKKSACRNLKKPFEIKYPITNVKQKITFGEIHVNRRTDNKLEKKKKKETLHLAKGNGRNRKQISQERKISYNKSPDESSKGDTDKEKELKPDKNDYKTLASRNKTKYQYLTKPNSNSDDYVASAILLKSDSKVIQAVRKSENNKFVVPIKGNVILKESACTSQKVTRLRSTEKNKNTTKLVIENARQQSIALPTKHFTDFKDQIEFTKKECRLAQIKPFSTNVASNLPHKNINTKNFSGIRSRKPIEINSKNSSDLKYHQILKENKIPTNIDNTQKSKENDFKPLKEYIDVNKVTSYHLEDNKGEVMFLNNFQREKGYIQETEFIKDGFYENTSRKDDTETNQIFYKNVDKTKVLLNDILKEDAKVDYLKQHSNTAENAEKKSYFVVKQISEETVTIPIKNKAINKPIYARKLNFHERPFSRGRLRGEDFSNNEKQTCTKYKQKPSSYMELALLKDSSNREKHIYNNTHNILCPNTNAEQDENTINTDNEINKILASKDFILEKGKMIFKIPKFKPKLSTPGIKDLYTEILDNSVQASNIVNSAEISSMGKQQLPKSIAKENISEKVLKIPKPSIKISLPDLVSCDHWSLLNKQKKQKLDNPIKIKELEANKTLISDGGVCQIGTVTENITKKPSIKTDSQATSGHKDDTIKNILRKPKIIIKFSHFGEKRKLDEHSIMVNKLDPQKNLKYDKDVCNTFNSNNNILKRPSVEKEISHNKQYDEAKVFSGKLSPITKMKLPNLREKYKLHLDPIKPKMMDLNNQLKSYIDTCQSIILNGNKVERPSIRKEPPPSNKKEDKDKKNPRKPKPAIRFPPSSHQEKPKLYDDPIKSKELGTKNELKFDIDIGQSDTAQQNKADKNVINNDFILRERLKSVIAYVKELQNKNENSNLIKQAEQIDNLSTKSRKYSKLSQQVFDKYKNRSHENCFIKMDGSKTISEQLMKVLKLNSNELSIENIKAMDGPPTDHVTELNNTSTSKNQPLPPHIIRKIMKLKLKLDKGTNHKQVNENENVVSVVTKSHETSIQKPVLKPNHSDSSLMTMFLLEEDDEKNTVLLDKARPTALDNIKKSKNVITKIPLKRMAEYGRSPQKTKKAEALIPELSKGKEIGRKSMPKNIKTLDTAMNKKHIQFEEKRNKTNINKIKEITLNPIDKIGLSKTLAGSCLSKDDNNQLNKENAKDVSKNSKSENIKSDTAINIKRIHCEENCSPEKNKENVKNIIKDSFNKRHSPKTPTEKTLSSDGKDQSKIENIRYANKTNNNVTGKSKIKRRLDFIKSTQGSDTRIHCQQHINDKMKQDNVLEIVRDPDDRNKLFKTQTKKIPTNDTKDQSKAENSSLTKKSFNTREICNISEHVAKNRSGLKKSNVLLKIKNNKLNKMSHRVELQKNKAVVKSKSRSLVAVVINNENTTNKTKFVSKESCNKSKNERNNSGVNNIDKMDTTQVTQNSTFNHFKEAEKNSKTITEIKKTNRLIENIRSGVHLNEEIKTDKKFNNKNTVKVSSKEEKKANNEKTNKKDKILLSKDNLVRIVVDVAEKKEPLSDLQTSTSVKPTGKASQKNTSETDTNVSFFKCNNILQSDLHLNAASKNYFNCNLKTSFEETIEDILKDTRIEETKHPETLVMIDLRSNTSEVKFLDISTKNDIGKSSSQKILSKKSSKSLENLNKQRKNYFSDFDYSYINRLAQKKKKDMKYGNNGEYCFKSHLSNEEKKVQNRSEQESNDKISEIKNTTSSVSINEYSNNESMRNFSLLSNEVTENISNTNRNTFTKKVRDKSKRSGANKNSINMYSKDPDEPIEDKHKEKVDKKANKSEKQKKALDKEVNKSLNKSETKIVKAPSYFRGGRRYNKLSKPPNFSAGRSKNIQKGKAEKNQAKGEPKNHNRRNDITFLLQNQLISDLDKLKLLRLIGKEDLDKIVEKLKINPNQVKDSDFYTVSAVEKELYNRKKSRDKMYRDFRKKMSDLLQKAKTVQYTGKTGTRSVAPTTSSSLKKFPVDMAGNEVTKNKNIQNNILSPVHLLDVDKQSKTSNEIKTKNIIPTKAPSSKNLSKKQTEHSTYQTVDLSSKENAVALNKHSEKTNTERDNNTKSDNNKKNAKGKENDKESPKASLNDTAEISEKPTNSSKSSEKTKEREFREVIREELNNIFENGPPNVNKQMNLVAKVEEIMDTNKTLWKFNKNFNKKLYDHFKVSSKTSPYVLKVPVTIEKELKTFSDIKRTEMWPEFQKKECVSILIPPRDLRRFLNSIKNNDVLTLLNKHEEKPLFEQKTELPRYYGPKITYMAVNKSETERSFSEKGSNTSLKETKTILEPKSNSKNPKNENVKNENDENDPKLK